VHSELLGGLSPLPSSSTALPPRSWPGFSTRRSARGQETGARMKVQELYLELSRTVARNVCHWCLGNDLGQLQEGQQEAADGQADQCQVTQDRGQPPVYVGFHR
jgi:hypothetical protein